LCGLCFNFFRYECAAENVQKFLKRQVNSDLQNTMRGTIYIYISAKNFSNQIHLNISNIFKIFKIDKELKIARLFAFFLNHFCKLYIRYKNNRTCDMNICHFLVY
jgi:hypothetical protein